MAKLSPLQRVRAEHGSKAALADKVLDVVSAPEDADEDAYEQRIRTLSNAKLLRIWDAHQKLSEKHGSKDALVDKIVAAKFSGGNEPYKAKIATYTEARLLDLARQVGV